MTHRLYPWLLASTLLVLSSCQDPAQTPDRHQAQQVQGQQNDIIGPDLLDPILDFLASGDPLTPEKFLSLFGQEPFPQKQLNQIVALYAQSSQPELMKILHILGRGDPRAAAILYLMQRGGVVTSNDSKTTPPLPLPSGGGDGSLATGLWKLLASGQQPSAHQLLELFGHQNPQLLAVVRLWEKKTQPQVEQILQALGQDDSRLMYLIRLTQRGQPLDLEQLVALLGASDSVAAKLLALIQNQESPDALEVLHWLGHDDPRLLDLVALANLHRPLEVAKVMALAGAKDPELTTIAQILSAGRKLDVPQVLKLLSHTVSPQVAALISWVGHHPGNFTLADLADGGSLAPLFNQHSRQDILQAVRSSPFLTRIFKHYSNVPRRALLADTSTLHLSSMLNERGKPLLKRAMLQSQSLRELMAQKGHFAWTNILSDKVVWLASDGTIPLSIRSTGGRLGDALLAVTGSFRGRFGSVAGRGLEVLRIANLGDSPAKEVSFNLSDQFFAVERSHCKEILEPGHFCELWLRAQAAQGKSNGKVTATLRVNFFNGHSPDQMHLPLEALLSQQP